MKIMFFNKSVVSFKAGFLLLLALCFTASIAAQEIKSYRILQIPNNLTKAAFDPFGGYLVYGQTPRIFKDFSNFTLDKVSVSTSATQMKIVGGVIINEGEKSAIYQMEEIRLSPTELFFKTEILNNVRYEFAGKYLKKGSLSRFNDKKVPVMQGTLKRYRDDKVVDTEELKFSFKVWKAKYYVSQN